MNKMVFAVFKAIAIAIIMVFVFDMGMYLYKALTLDQRMKNIMANMQRTVAENNYLPDGAYNVYSVLIKQAGDTLNGNEANSFVGTADGGSDAYFLNYKKSAVGVSTEVTDALASTGNTVHTDMHDIGSYGDIMVVQAAVMVRQPMWGFGGNGNHSAENWDVLEHSTHTFVYTYYVPCMNYSTHD